jgi:hypothetical protein
MPSTNSNITETIGNKPDIPKGVQIGDFLVARYTSSQWSRHLPWEDWDHSALITETNPLKVIEVSGIMLHENNTKKIFKNKQGVVEYEFLKPRTIKIPDDKKTYRGNLWLSDNLVEVQWLKPIFPKPLRSMAHNKVPWKKRRKITETQARKGAIAYARHQLGKPFKLSLFKSAEYSATKWDEGEWYCSLLIFKSYSRTVTNMYLESYEPLSGFFVTPEDLVQSKRSVVYHKWFNKKFIK